MSEQRIIKFDEVPKELQKYLGQDKIFVFECEVVNDKLRLGLKEINSYSPYYYETFYSYDELRSKNYIFNACKDLDAVKGHLIKLFKGTAKLSSLDDDEDVEKIKIKFKINIFADVVEESFDLERKTIQNKDQALKFLFNIQKNNINLFQRIIEKCEDDDYKNQQVAQEILNILQN